MAFSKEKSASAGAPVFSEILSFSSDKFPRNGSFSAREKREKQGENVTAEKELPLYRGQRREISLFTANLPKMGENAEKASLRADLGEKTKIPLHGLFSSTKRNFQPNTRYFRVFGQILYLFSLKKRRKIKQSLELCGFEQIFSVCFSAKIRFTPPGQALPLRRTYSR